jgi:hypothetical protein
MIAFLLVVKTLANDSLSNVGSKDVLKHDVKSYGFLPERVEGSRNRQRFFGLTMAVESDHWVAVSFDVGWGKFLTFIEVKHESIWKLLLVLNLDGFELRSSVCVEVYSANQISSNFSWRKQIQGFVSLQFLDV